MKFQKVPDGTKLFNFIRQVSNTIKPIQPVLSSIENLALKFLMASNENEGEIENVKILKLCTLIFKSTRLVRGYLILLKMFKVLETLCQKSL